MSQAGLWSRRILKHRQRPPTAPIFFVVRNVQHVSVIFDGRDLSNRDVDALAAIFGVVHISQRFTALGDSFREIQSAPSAAATCAIIVVAWSLVPTRR